MQQGNVEGFFNNVKNADKLGGLVDDVRDAVMYYQVCDWGRSIALASETLFRLHCNKICMTRTVSLL